MKIKFDRNMITKLIEDIKDKDIRSKFFNKIKIKFDKSLPVIVFAMVLFFGFTLLINDYKNKNIQVVEDANIGNCHKTVAYTDITESASEETTINITETTTTMTTTTTTVAPTTTAAPTTTKKPTTVATTTTTKKPTTAATTKTATTTEAKSEEGTSNLINLGRFKLTAYCSCSKCCGKWAGSPTASGVMPRANHTIAVDTRVIPFGTKVIINGRTYVAEDTGSAIKGNKIDIYFDSHQAALNFGVQYADVYKVAS